MLAIYEVFFKDDFCLSSRGLDFFITNQMLPNVMAFGVE